MVELRGSFDDYLRGLKPSFRYKVQRTVRKLRQMGGDLELERCRAPEQVERLFAAATRVRERSWQRPVLGTLEDDAYQTSRDSLVELARRGLLRSYVLRAGGIPCAYVIGYQYRDVYFYAVPGYDRAFARHSPGSALLYLMLEDLWALDRPRLLSFGRGDDDYKRRFGNREVCVGRWLVLRRTLQNQVRVLNHRLLSRMARLRS
jgi:CelD/BcsL family acetyltransferase involved in cellulose biosynthesis